MFSGPRNPKMGLPWSPGPCFRPYRRPPSGPSISLKWPYLGNRWAHSELLSHTDVWRRARHCYHVPEVPRASLPGATEIGVPSAVCGRGASRPVAKWPATLWAWWSESPAGTPGLGVPAVLNMLKVSGYLKSSDQIHTCSERLHYRLVVVECVEGARTGLGLCVCWMCRRPQ